MLLTLVMSLSKKAKVLIFTGLDVASALAAVACALALVASLRPDISLNDHLVVLPIAAITAALVTSHLGLPRIRLNNYEIYSVVRSGVFAIAVSLVLLVVDAAQGMALPVATHVVNGLLLMMFCVLWRWVLLLVTLEVYQGGDGSHMRILIYGAGQTGQQLVAALRQEQCIRVIAFIDDNPTLQGLAIAGVRVYGSAAIKNLVLRKQVDRIVLAMPSLSEPALARIRHQLRDTGCEVYALPSFAAIVGTDNFRNRMPEVSLNVLLGRNRLESELPGVSHTYAGRSIVVTGAGGSIGSELCRQVIACQPDKLVLVDHSEFALYEIEQELREIRGHTEVVPILGSVTDPVLVDRTLRKHDVEIVLHAAAYKHLTLVETNVISGLKNNVLGTRIMAEAARRHGVARFILISSDKAVRPTNIMGASKRLSELVVQDLATRPGATKFAMVRFGNVLGSSGSVVPLFQRQIERGGPLTLTHEGITRYFMTRSEAIRLVLLAGSFAQGGEVFVLDMGDPVPIRKLARKMIEGAGYTVRDETNPDGDIEIEIIGLRPGEKLHEELLVAPNMLATPHPKILRAQDACLSEFEIAAAIKHLQAALETHDEAGARAVVLRWVEPATEGRQEPRL